MDLGLTGKVALITGASHGLGRVIALTLASEGCDVMLTGRDEAALNEVAELIRQKNRKASLCAADLLKPGAVENLVAAHRREFGHLDILINNAGATKHGDFFALTDQDWQDGFALKFFAHVTLTRYAWPMLKERRGTMIVMSGTGGRQPMASFTIGASVNAACIAFAKAMADQGKADEVQVNCITPSQVDSPRLRRNLQQMSSRLGLDEDAAKQKYFRELGVRRFGRPEDVADLITFMVSARATWLHGATIDLDGGQVRSL